MSELFINEIYRCRKTVIEMLEDRGYDTRNCMLFHGDEFETIMNSDIKIRDTPILTVIDIHTDDKRVETLEGVYDIESKSIEASGDFSEDEEEEQTDKTEEDQEGETTVDNEKRDETEKIYELSMNEEEEEEFDFSDDDEDIELTGGAIETTTDGIKSKTVIVKFVFDTKLLTKSIEAVNIMSKGKDCEIIFVLCSKRFTTRDPDTGNPILLEKIRKMETDSVQFFYYKTLIVNITKHQYVPRHVLIQDKNEIRDILDYYSLKSVRGLPVILKKDPICRYYNGRVGDIFKIFRCNKNDGDMIVYRGVIE